MASLRFLNHRFGFFVFVLLGFAAFAPVVRLPGTITSKTSCVIAVWALDLELGALATYTVIDGEAFAAVD